MARLALPRTQHALLTDAVRSSIAHGSYERALHELAQAERRSAFAVDLRAPAARAALQAVGPTQLERAIGPPSLLFFLLLLRHPTHPFLPLPPPSVALVRACAAAAAAPATTRRIGRSEQQRKERRTAFFFSFCYAAADDAAAGHFIITTRRPPALMVLTIVVPRCRSTAGVIYRPATERMSHYFQVRRRHVLRACVLTASY